MIQLCERSRRHQNFSDVHLRKASVSFHITSFSLILEVVKKSEPSGHCIEKPWTVKAREYDRKWPHPSTKPQGENTLSPKMCRTGHEKLGQQLESFQCTECVSSYLFESSFFPLLQRELYHGSLDDNINKQEFQKCSEHVPYQLTSKGEIFCLVLEWKGCF